MGAGVKSRKAKPKETGKSSMNLISKLVIVGATVATMALPASAAFANTTAPPAPAPAPVPVQPIAPVLPGGNGGHIGFPGGNQGHDQNNHGPGHDQGGSNNNNNDHGYRGSNNGYNNYDPSRNYGHTYYPSYGNTYDPGYYTNSYGYGGNGYGSGYTNCYCQHPVVPKCDCQTPITFQFPCTYGSWLYETDGPALYNGEVLRYDGQ